MSSITTRNPRDVSNRGDKEIGFEEGEKSEKNGEVE